MDKILVIEDERPLLEEALDALRYADFEVIGAENGLVGVQLAREHRPDLIVCDITMPELDGYAVLQELRCDSATATIPFIFLTARAERIDVRKGMELGADDYLTKPFQHSELLTAIRARLARHTAIETRRLRAFSHSFVARQESERRQIARRLQDEVGQLLTGLKFTLGMCENSPPDALSAALAEAEDLVDRALAKVNNAALDLWPVLLDHLGLFPALLWQFERYTAQTQVRVNFQHAGLDRPLEPAVKTAIYRIAQEALANVADHAGVAEVTVQVWVEDNVLNAQITDAGSGFHLEESLIKTTSIGLMGMRERAFALNGELIIVTAPGEGTRVIVRIPLGDSTEQPAPLAEALRHWKIAPDTESTPPEGAVETSGRREKAARPQRVGAEITIVLADSNDIMRRGLRSLLEAEAGFAVLGETAQGADVMGLVECHQPAILVLDLAIPGVAGLDITRQITRYFPQTRVLILSTYTEETYFLEAFRSGAAGYILKNTSADDLAAAAHEVISGRRYLSPALSERAVESYIDIQRLQKDSTFDACGTLTSREREILHLVLAGHTNAQIAAQLVISP